MAATITACTPDPLVWEQQITITGTGLSTATAITFSQNGGIVTSIILPALGASDTTIVATMPKRPVPGDGSYTLGLIGTVPQATRSVTVASASLSNVAPAPLIWGQTVTISGQNLGTTQSPLTLSQNGAVVIKAIATTSWKASTIVATLPAQPSQGDGLYDLGVTVGSAILSTSVAVAAAPPGLTGITINPPASPVKAAPGDAVVVFPTPAQAFGNAPCVVTLEQGALSVPLIRTSSANQIRVELPAVLPNGDGNYTLRVAVGGNSRTADLSVITGTSSTPRASAFSDPVRPGGTLMLQPLTGSFGAVGGNVILTDSNNVKTPIPFTAGTPGLIAVTVPTSVTPPANNQYTISIEPTLGAKFPAKVLVDSKAFGVPAKKSVKLPKLPVDPLFSFGTPVSNPAGYLGAATATGQRWRYELLRSQAVRAAEQAAAFDNQIMTLIQLAAGKVEAAEQILNPTLIAAIKQIQADTQSVEDLASSAALADIISDIASAAATALMLEELITWLIETDPIKFWIGLFGALIEDIASFDSGMPRTKKYIHKSASVGLLAGANLAANLLQTIDAEIDQFVAPLRAAVADVVGGTSAAMHDVFNAFDEPLLQKLGAEGEGDLADINPLIAVGAALTNAIDDLVQQIKDQIRQILADPASLLEKIIITYIVAPVLVMLAIGFAGGPFSAAVFAAVVLIAVEELAHLIIKWLTGPLLKQVDKAKQKVLAAAAQLQSLLAAQAKLLEATNPDAIIEALAGELRELKDLLPEVWLDAVAELLDQARDGVLKDAIELALSAERSLGVENGTAFDAIAPAYPSGLPPTTQLPGGSDASLFGGAALLRDLDALDQQRTALLDGKDVPLPVPVSILDDLLGGDATRFADLLRDGRVIVHLTEAALLDARTPGVYRALIEEVSVSGVFDAATPLSASFALPVAVTHLGPSQTRISLRANPNAPPTQGDGLPAKDDFLGSLLPPPFWWGQHEPFGPGGWMKQP